MFDAASIVSSDHGGPSAYRVTPSGIVYTNATLGDCLLAAYQVSRFEMVGPDIRAGPDGAELKNHTMSQVAHYLSRLPIDLPVVDTTGIEGRYDFGLTLGQRTADKKPETAGETSPSLRAVQSTVVNDALRPYGLELQSRTLHVPVIVIDEARREPTPN
jgi:hypothetical protein